MNHINRFIETIRLFFESDDIKSSAYPPIITWGGFISYIILIIIIGIMMITQCGCTSTRYYEHKVTGLDLTFPVCGIRAGISIGVVEDTSTSVQGGTSFNSQSTSGTGVNGMATTAHVTTFKSNSQLNENNIVKVMESPTVAEKAKIILAKQLGDGVAAPTFDPVAMRTRDGAIYSNGYKGNAIPNDFSTTGVDKIVEDVTGMVNNITDDTTGVAETLIGGTSSTISTLFKCLASVKFWGAIGLIFAFLICLFFRKKKSSSVADAIKSKELNPPEFHEPQPDEAVDIDDEAAGVIHQEHEVEVVEPVIVRETLPWWKRLLRAILALLTAWKNLGDDDKASITTPFKK